MRIYYNKTTECCVMVLPATISQQDTGMYRCDVRIKNAESDELTLRADDTVMIEIAPESNPTTGPPVPVIAVVGGIALLILVAVGVVVLIGRYRHNDYERLDGESKEFVH